MSDSDTFVDVAKKTKTVPIHARIPEPDVAVVDRVAKEEFSSRSQIIARIVREWVKRRLSSKR